MSAPSPATMLRSLHLPRPRRRVRPARGPPRLATAGSRPAPARAPRVRRGQRGRCRASRLALFALLLSGGSTSLLVRDQYGNFYDAQARALLAGHWDVPARALFFEGFRIHGKTYTYFGVWPAMLRMPFLELFPAPPVA